MACLLLLTTGRTEVKEDGAEQEGKLVQLKAISTAIP